MKVSQMTGTVWHKERVHREEGDNRRYKGRCSFYRYEGNYCIRYMERCHGSAHCDLYQAISDEEFEQRQKALHPRAKNTGEDKDTYWY